MKRPKAKEISLPEKDAKLSTNPESYKNMYPAWRLSHLDLDGEFGYYSYNEIFELCCSDELLDFVADNGLDDIFSLISACATKQYVSLKQFFNELSKIAIPDAEFFRLLSKCIYKSYFIKEIYPKLKEFESLTWREIEAQTFGEKTKTKHHSINVSRLDNVARKRLKKLQLDDVDEVYSLRLEGKLRLFGLRKDNYFNLLWVDMDHQVCPVSK